LSIRISVLPPKGGFFVKSKRSAAKVSGKTAKLSGFNLKLALKIYFCFKGSKVNISNVVIKTQNGKDEYCL